MDVEAGHRFHMRDRFYIRELQPDGTIRLTETSLKEFGPIRRFGIELWKTKERVDYFLVELESATTKQRAVMVVPGMFGDCSSPMRDEMGITDRTLVHQNSPQAVGSTSFFKNPVKVSRSKTTCVGGPKRKFPYKIADSRSPYSGLETTCAGHNIGCPEEKVPHRLIDYRCVPCGKHFKDFASFSDHHARFHRRAGLSRGLVEYSCATCEKLFESFPALSDHHVSTHFQGAGGSNVKLIEYSCATCEEQFTSFVAFSYHVRTHSRGPGDQSSKEKSGMMEKDKWYFP